MEAERQVSGVTRPMDAVSDSERRDGGRETGFRKERLAPRAAVLIESMRDVGYSLSTAAADIVDNSIAAKARAVRMFADCHGEQPKIGFVDDGCGMSEEELLAAMRPGSLSPLDRRSSQDLGRFGLGLKTASFSQCRRLTVISRKHGATSCARWDLDVVAETDDWYVEVLDSSENLAYADCLGSQGTVVLWEKLDRIVDADEPSNRRNMVEQLNRLTEHLELVFHRYLSGESGLQRLAISINGRNLNPFDPFNINHDATHRGPEEVFGFKNQEIRIQPFTLPHHGKVSREEWERLAGRDGYIRNQGFYVYRAKRLIVHGTWFNLARQTELTKLARVRVDIPTEMDSAWKIDVKKASASPPPPLRERLRNVLPQLGAVSRRVVRNQGGVTAGPCHSPVWKRVQESDQVSYRVNSEHPVLRHFSDGLDQCKARQFRQLLSLVGATIPIDAISNDAGSDLVGVARGNIQDSELREYVANTYDFLAAEDRAHEEIVKFMERMELFGKGRPVVEDVLARKKVERES